jgi:hypothetical protein
MTNTFHRNDATFSQIAYADISGAPSTSTSTAIVGNVIGPASNTADNVPQWNGANSKTLKDGLAVGVGASKLIQFNGSTQYPAADGSLITNLTVTGFVPLSSTTPVVGTVITGMTHGSGTTTNGATVAGSALGHIEVLNLGPCGTPTPIFTAWGLSGTWKNISGVSIADDRMGVWVRTA